jgi:hypothetical protein
MDAADGRGACRGQRPLSEGMQVTTDHDLITWLTKDLVPDGPAAGSRKKFWDALIGCSRHRVVVDGDVGMRGERGDDLLG